VAHENLNAGDQNPFKFEQPQSKAARPTAYNEKRLMSETKEMPLVELSAKDLPAYCPNPSMPRWSAHPRVFIDVTHGEARCPYCGTRYKLRDGEIVKHH
jgi:uncharacterized Zn-finger protein